MVAFREVMAALAIGIAPGAGDLAFNLPLLLSLDKLALLPVLMRYCRPLFCFLRSSADIMFMVILESSISPLRNPPLAGEAEMLSCN